MYDIYSRVAGMLCDILGLANNKTAMISADQYLKKDMDLISDLLKRDYKLVKQLASEVDDIRWLQCDYILHALFYALREKIPAKILLNSSDEFILQLQDVVNVAKKNAQPTKEETDFAKSLGEEYSRRSASCKNDQLKKNKNNVVRFSSFITLTVARHWDEMVAELNRWSEYIDERMSLGSLNRPKKRQLNLSINPQKWELQSSAGNRTGESPKISDKIGITTNTKEKPMKQQQAPVGNGDTPVKAQGKTEKPVEASIKKDSDSTELWTVSELAKKLGMKDAQRFHNWKCVFMSKHPDVKSKVNSWFVVSKENKRHFLLFRAEHFQELKQLKESVPESKIKDDIIVVDGVELWTTQKLVRELGYASVQSFHTMKWKFLKVHPEAKEKFDKYFGGSVGAQKRKLFCAKYFDELKALLKETAGTPENTAENVASVVADESVVEPVQTVASVLADIAPVSNGKEVSDETNLNGEHTIDLTDVKGLEIYLGQLTELFNQTRKEEKNAKDSLENLEQQVKITKEKMESANLLANKLQASIDEAKLLLDEYGTAEEGMRVATANMDTAKDKIIKFLRSDTYLQK